MADDQKTIENTAETSVESPEDLQLKRDRFEELRRDLLAMLDTNELYSNQIKAEEAELGLS